MSSCVCLLCTAELYRLDPIDYGRRVAVEKELAADPGGALAGLAGCFYRWLTDWLTD